MINCPRCGDLVDRLHPITVNRPPPNHPRPELEHLGDGRYNWHVCAKCVEDHDWRREG